LPKKVSLAAGGYPPDLDGIGDYAYWLARALAERPDVLQPVDVYTRTGDHAPAEGVRIRPFFEFSRQSSFRNLLPLVREDCPDWLVLQYNPFSWGARGWCSAVPWTLGKLKEIPRAPKVAVMFHETTVPKWPWRFALMYAWQRPILRGVARQADRIFVSTKRWIPELVSAGAVAPMSLLPVGANIPRSSLSKEDARRLLGVQNDCLVLGVFGSAHPSRLLDWIAEAAEAVSQKNLDLLVLHVGPEGEVMRRAMEALPFRSLGVKSAIEVADALRAMDCVVSPFIDGISSRRGSVIAALNNGIRVATTGRHWTDDCFLSASSDAVLVSTAHNKTTFAREVAEWAKPIDHRVARGVESWHDANFSWPIIAEQMMIGLPY
jgi:glycosyltransferase involved in cell wall biosynthesis